MKHMISAQLLTTSNTWSLIYLNSCLIHRKHGNLCERINPNVVKILVVIINLLFLKSKVRKFTMLTSHGKCSRWYFPKESESNQEIFNIIKNQFSSVFSFTCGTRRSYHFPLNSPYYPFVCWFVAYCHRIKISTPLKKVFISHKLENSSNGEENISFAFPSQQQKCMKKNPVWEFESLKNVCWAFFFSIFIMDGPFCV